MPEITFTLSAAHLARVLDALGAGWEPTLRDGAPNPQTKQQFARARMVGWLRERTFAHERQVALDAIPKDALDIS